MDDRTGKIAKNLARFAETLADHDRENPTHHAWGIGLSYFDCERLGLEEGEEILPGIIIQVDGDVSGNFRILCDKEHDGQLEQAEERVMLAVVAPQAPLSVPEQPSEYPARPQGRR